MKRRPSVPEDDRRRLMPPLPQPLLSRSLLRLSLRSLRQLLRLLRFLRPRSLPVGRRRTLRTELSKKRFLKLILTVLDAWYDSPPKSRSVFSPICTISCNVSMNLGAFSNIHGDRSSVS